MTDTQIIRIRKLTDAAVHFIEDQRSCLEGPEEHDHFVCGRTFVETTRRVLSAVLDRLDVEEYVDLALAASVAETDAQLDFVERVARKSIRGIEAKLTKALA